MRLSSIYVLLIKKRAFQLLLVYMRRMSRKLSMVAEGYWTHFLNLDLGTAHELTFTKSLPKRYQRC